MLLSTGAIWRLDAPRAEDLDIRDIAHALSHLCRFGGHCREFYSVAQHSVLSALMAHKAGMDAKSQRTVLLHDASEAYLVDLPRPVKQMLPEYKSMELRVQELVAQRWNMVNPHPAFVKEIDNRMLNTEQLALMPESPAYLEGVEPYTDMNIVPWGPEQARSAFLSYFKLCRED